MRQLFLHVGHGKTGTSFMQSVLANVREDLLLKGVNYPNHNSLENAAAGKITSGNGPRLIDAIEKSVNEKSANEKSTNEKNVIEPAWYNRADKVCFSSEFLFDYLLPNKGRDSFLSFAKNNKIEKINILLVIRNPIDQVTSGYQQFIKRGGGCVSIDDYCSGFKMPIRVKKFIENFGNHENCTLTIKNYSNHAHQLDKVLFDFLKLENLSTLPTDKKVNRSLGTSELLMQKEFNKVLGKSGGIFADPLCDLLPDIEVEKVYPSVAVATDLIARNLEAMEFVNQYVVGEAYNVSVAQLAPQREDRELTFTPEQLQIIGKSVGLHIQALREKIAELENT